MQKPRSRWGLGVQNQRWYHSSGPSDQRIRATLVRARPRSAGPLFRRKQPSDLIKLLIEPVCRAERKGSQAQSGLSHGRISGPTGRVLTLTLTKLCQSAEPQHLEPIRTGTQRPIRRSGRARRHYSEPTAAKASATKRRRAEAQSRHAAQ